jgi:hypothetical protein
MYREMARSMRTNGFEMSQEGIVKMVRLEGVGEG